jgi:hypothetical protein
MLKKQIACFHLGQKISLLTCLLLFSFLSFAQQKITVNGTVVSDQNEPLSGVSVKVEKSSVGTTTQSNGTFTLQVNKGATLNLSMVGFGDKQIKVEHEGDIGITPMVTMVSSLGEVVVVGYGTQKKAWK